jgi:signal transduction histidine kinase/CheY-like chemotaxis protein
MNQDWRLMTLAALVCLGGVAIARVLLRYAVRGKEAGDTRRFEIFQAACAVTVSLTMWSAQFLALRALPIEGRIGYDLLGAAGSLTIITAAMLVSVRMLFMGSGPAWRAGAVVVRTLGALGMVIVAVAALRFSGHIHLDPVTTGAATFVALIFSGLTMYFSGRQKTWGHVVGAVMGLVSIAALYLITIAGARITADPGIVLPPATLSETLILTWITGLVGALMIMAAAAAAFICITRSNAMARVREAIDTMPDGLAFYDADDRLVLWNAHYAEVNRELGPVLRPGMMFRELLDAGLSQDLYPDARGREQAWAGERMAARRGASQTVEQEMADGRWLRIQDRRTAGGGVVTSVNDITDLKHDARALVEARDAADAANLAKSQFLANMSHEIRTPLNGVIGVAQALSRTKLDREQREMLDLIESSGHTLQTLLSDILDLARVESGRLEIMAEPFDLGRAIREAAQLYSATAADKGLQFFVEVAPEAQVWVRGDVVRLKQILTNLVSNAVKFTSSGFISLTVAPGPDRDGRATLRFSVEDTGIGFDSAARERLFGRFEQADGGITRKFGGSGLGLSICKQLAGMMEGELDCESEPGGGSAFFLTLPFVPVAAPAAVEDHTAARLGDVIPTLRVLLADDHATNRKVVELILAQAPVELTCVENGAQALDAYRGGDFDLVLMDMQMPVMDGLEAIREIRLHEAVMGREATPIIMLTANALPEHVASGAAAGADRHLSKPFNAADLLGLVMDVAVGGPKALAA